MRFLVKPAQRERRQAHEAHPLGEQWDSPSLPPWSGGSAVDHFSKHPLHDRVSAAPPTLFVPSFVPPQQQAPNDPVTWSPPRHNSKHGFGTSATASSSAGHVAEVD